MKPGRSAWCIVVEAPDIPLPAQDEILPVLIPIYQRRYNVGVTPEEMILLRVEMSPDMSNKEETPQEQAVRFDPKKQPWPDGIVPWKNAGYQPRDMSWGYVETPQGRVHVQTDDWIITNAQGDRRVEKEHESPPEITRTVGIEHAGEKISIEVHVHLSKEEIERVICPVVEHWIVNRVRAGGPVGADMSLPPLALTFVIPEKEQEG